ncbi:hypothetical protein BDA96_09G213700 [Sorghum bicolor]|uniref:RING-type domain-containing protein n=1 Tax=Sorghum bicolor TaxID=4558 RepID=A0A921U5B7_SORBI|nr:hypothetical protein BDA96_09G213700 [Sorghum bicolor]
MPHHRLTPIHLHAPVFSSSITTSHAVPWSHDVHRRQRARLDGGNGVPLRLAPRLLPPRSPSIYHTRPTSCFNFLMVTWRTYVCSVHGVDAGLLQPRGAGRRPGVLAARAGQFSLRARHRGQRGRRVTRERRRSGALRAACGFAARRADRVAGVPSRRRAGQLSQGWTSGCSARSQYLLASGKSFHQNQWTYFLNKGARLQADYSVMSEDDVHLPLCIIIAQGKESFIRWTEMPSVHNSNSTLFWGLVQGNGTVEQTVNLSSEYYIAVRNLNNHHDTTLEFRIRALLYNTSGADYRCSPGPGHAICTYRLPFLGRNVAVLLSGHTERLNSDAQHVKLSYEPRWTVYVVGSVVLALVLLLLYEILDQLFGPCTGGGGGADLRRPLLAGKEDDGASLGSSYDSVSHDGSDDREPEERGEGGGGCVLCCDAPKDCFFLPCGHSATCYACGARVVEENGGCPFCRRKLKKVRRIFTV